MSRWALVLLFTAGSAIAQHKAQITGEVRDESHAMVADALVTLVNLDTGVRRTSRSDQQGFYAVSSLAPGSYKITIRREGFQTLARVGVPLGAAETIRADFTLHIGSVQEEVTVTAEMPMINAGNAAYGVVITRESAEGLPLNARGLQGLIELAPGVLYTAATAGEAGQFSATGQRPNANYFTVDGISANNGVSGSALPGQFSGGALPAMTAIGSLHNVAALGEVQEVRVQTSTFSPEFGRLPGAQVSVSTRSGSNQLHGQMSHLLRHERLSAADWFANRAGLGSAPQRMQNTGAVLGGALRQNSSFFLASFEHLRLRHTSASLLSSPIAFVRARTSGVNRRYLDAFPLANGPSLTSDTGELTARATSESTVTVGSLRLDQALRSSGSLFMRFSETPSVTRSGYLQTSEADFRSRTVSIGVVSALSPRVTNDARVGYSRTAVGSRWLSGFDLAPYLPPPGVGQRLYALSIQGVGQLYSGDPGQSRQTQWNLVDTTALTTGRHDLRIGVDYQRLAPHRSQAISTVLGVFDSLEQVVSGAVPRIVHAQTDGGSSTIETLSLFAQDTWRVTPRLNLNYGVRWEFTPPPSYRTAMPGTLTAGSSGPLPAPITLIPNIGLSGYAQTPIWPTRWNQFAPRVGLAWRLDREGHLVLRAGAGVFYDLGFSSSTDLINGAPYNRIRSFATPAVVLPAESQIQYGFASNLRLPYSWQWNVALERAFGSHSALSFAWLGSAGRQLLRREGYVQDSMHLPQLVLATNNGRSDYHSLQVHYRRRVANGLKGVASYSWGHSTDNGSWDSATFLVYDAGSRQGDHGSSDFDARHSVQAALVYDLPAPNAFSSLRGVVRGWTLSGFFRARTGFPVDVVSGDNPFGLGFDNSIRPDVKPGIPLWLDDALAPGGRRLNPAAFSAPIGRQGTLRRNALRGNGLGQVDLALRRKFSLREGWSLELRAEAFNVTNRAQFGDPYRFVSSPLFGRSTSSMALMLGAGRPNSGLIPAFQAGGARSAQLGVYLRF